MHKIDVTSSSCNLHSPVQLDLEMHELEDAERTCVRFMIMLGELGFVFDR